MCILIAMCIQYILLYTYIRVYTNIFLNNRVTNEFDCLRFDFTKKGTLYCRVSQYISKLVYRYYTLNKKRLSNNDI